MASNPSLVKKIESAIDDIADLWQRHKVKCIIVIAIIVIPVGLNFYFGYVKVPKLKADISKKKETIEQKQEEIRALEKSLKSVEKERDKAEIQLAPFLAVANQTFPNTPPDKRLEMLLIRLEQAISNIQDAARSISPERSLAPDFQSSLIINLKKIQALDVKITSVLGDTEGYAFAYQIKDVFEKAEWNVNGVNQAVFKRPVKGLMLTFGKEPSPELQRALSALFNSLGYPREAAVNEKLGENALEIVVGSK